MSQGDDPVTDTDIESNDWTAPSIIHENTDTPISKAVLLQPQPVVPHEPPEANLEYAHYNSFEADITETEAKVGTAIPMLAKKGEHCQRLGSDGWQNIRYADVQKQFQATPVFTSLKTNSSLAMVTPPWQSVTILEKMDLCLGAISYGLLQQRKHFTDIYDSASPEVKDFISKEFLAKESAFKKTSDALLQYTCGKRSEVIQQRRGIYKPNNKTLSELLHAIPPSTTSLFSEPQLSELIKEQGGVMKFFPGRFRSQYRQKISRKENMPSQEAKNRRVDNFKRYNYKRQPVRSANHPAPAGGKRQFQPPPGKQRPRFDGRK